MDELLIFQRVKRALDGIGYTGMKVESTDSPLADALLQLGCFPYANILCDSLPLDCELSVDDKPAGTFEKPDIDLILKESTVSSFGKGEKTVLDPKYRNGKEIPAERMKFGTERASKNSYGRFTDVSGDEISAAMFPERTVKLKFYKLAIYEEGGHFDWHMDTTHSDKHHATLLLALNTSWEGGELKLRRSGIETLVDLQPKAGQDKGVNLQAVAFYTDTEHKVEAVTKGTRIVLQYDIELVGWQYDEDDADDELFETIEYASKKRKRYQISSNSLTADDTSITKVTDIIANLLASGEGEVAFAMQHLYRKSSILPEYLKGADAQLYRALAKSFDVTLRPVILQLTSRYEGEEGSCVAIPWNHKPVTAGSDSDLDSDAEGDEEGTGSETKSQPKIFHLPVISAIRELSRKDHIEYTGNEAQPGEKQYVGGGMFVRQKKVEEK